MVKIKDLRALGTAGLEEKLLSCKKEQFNLRVQHATGQLTNISAIGKVRKEIAKIKTLISELKTNS